MVKTVGFLVGFLVQYVFYKCESSVSGSALPVSVGVVCVATCRLA